MMGADCYAFKVGNIDCWALLDGATVIGRAGILKRYPDATEADYERAYADLGLSIDDAVSSFNVLMAKVGNDLILVDTGEGSRPKGGFLPNAIRLAGYTPEAITKVIITHAHGDHVLGLLSADNQPVFPNATYIISTPEMELWQRSIDSGKVDQRPIVEMITAKGLRLIDTDEQIMSGVTAVPIPGHTAGQIAVMVESNGEKVIHCADMLHVPMQFAHPEWSPTFDADTSVSVPTRRAMLTRAADENRLLMFYHLPFPGLGRVSHSTQGFIWEPAH